MCAVDPAITAALVGVGGVVLGVVLTAALEARGRRRVGDEQREQARHARELIAAEELDEALVRASAALDRGGALEDRYAAARQAWEDGWVSYSPRVRQPELLGRYESVGNVLAEVVLGDRTVKELPRHVVARAIGNARSTLGHFMRGDELPAAAFPEPADLRRLLAEGDTAAIDQGDPLGPLKRWLAERPMPEFHTVGEKRKA